MLLNQNRIGDDFGRLKARKASYRRAQSDPLRQPPRGAGICPAEFGSSKGYINSVGRFIYRNH